MRIAQIAYTSGVLAPSMRSRVDDAQYRSGLSDCINMVCLPQGPLTRRRGSQYLVTAGDSAHLVRLFGFTFDVDDTFVLEFGRHTVDTRELGYIRFIQDDVQVTYTSPPAYVESQAFTSVVGNTINVVATTGFAINDPVGFTLDAGAVLPTPLLVGTTYYLKTVGATSVTLSATPGGATITLGGAPSGNLRLHYAYTAGDMVTWSGVGAGAFYCVQRPWAVGTTFLEFSPPNSAPASLYWYRLPSSGIYEIPTEYDDVDLEALRTEQSLDVVWLAHTDHPLRKLSRYDTTRWTIEDVTFTSSVAAPTGLSVSATLGETFVVDACIAGNPVQLRFYSEHRMSPGDVVYVKDAYNTGPVFDVPDGYYRIKGTPTASEVTLMHHDSGRAVDATSTNMNLDAKVQLVVNGFDANGDALNRYVVTALDVDNIESVASAEVSVDNNLYIPGARNTLTWDAVTGAVQYRVYRWVSGLFVRIGVTTDTTYTDALSPPTGDTLPVVDTTVENPAAVVQFQGRLVIARDDFVWMTRAGSNEDMTFHLIAQPDDRVAIAVRDVMGIRHIVRAAHLMLLTSSGEHRVTALNDDSITQSSVAVRRQSSIGSGHATPQLIDSTLLFAAARGGHLRAVEITPSAGEYAPVDLSLRASHLFYEAPIVALAVQRAPVQIVWAVLSDGRLLGLTFAPDERLAGWHEHSISGASVEDVLVLPDEVEDAVYLVVLRTIDGASVRMIERLRAVTGDVYLDSYSIGVPDGLSLSVPHLEGQTVVPVVDGVAQAAGVVTDGVLTLTATGAEAVVGLSYTSRMRTLPIAAQIEGLGFGRSKNLNKAWVEVDPDEASAFDVGAGENDDVLVPAHIDDIATGHVPVLVSPQWSDTGILTIRIDSTGPLTVRSHAVDVTLGGG